MPTFLATLSSLSVPLTILKRETCALDPDHYNLASSLAKAGQDTVGILAPRPSGARLLAFLAPPSDRREAPQPTPLRAPKVLPTNFQILETPQLKTIIQNMRVPGENSGAL